MNTFLTFMKRNYKILLVVVALSASLFAFKIHSDKGGDPEKDKLLLELIAFVVEKGHYEPKDINDEFSKGIYKDYITALDPSKRFLLQSDIDEFSKYELQLDDQIKNRDLTFFDLTYNRLKQRMDESQTYYKEILAKPFDYSVDEEINVDFEKLPFAKNKEELKDKWRKQIKLNTLSALVDKMKVQEDKAKGIKTEKTEGEKLKLNDDTILNEPEKTVTAKTDKDEKPKSYTELEKETRESSLKTMDDYFSFVQDLDREDWFSVFLNVIAERFDPHTSYFAPEEKEKFDVSMSGKFFGIGARLQKKNDYVEITELISGGPAWRNKELEAGDLIMKVAQGSGEPVDIGGMKLDEVVKKIKGPKNTEVKLTVKKVDGTVKVIKIVREEVEIEETYAKSSIVQKDGKSFGVIYLPKFYID